MDSLYKNNYTINYKGNLISLKSPKVMGIINLTPDSFYDQSRVLTNWQQQIDAQINDGADFLDLGGYSSRPGAEDISIQEECDRVLPVVEYLLKHFPKIPISVDTFRAKVAEMALNAGVGIINDISGGNLDPEIIPLIIKNQCIYIAMHLKGSPQNMQDNPVYENVTLEVVKHLSEIKEKLHQEGLCNLIVDPGFGFGKTIEHNYTLLKQFTQLQLLQVPILGGVSRKSMIYKSLQTTANEALNGTSVLHTLLLQKGCNILRVHDVKAAKEVITLLQLSGELT